MAGGCRSSRAPGALAALAGVLLPRLAQACPMCSSQQPGGAARIAALGLMMLAPFVIAFTLYSVLRRTGGPSPERGAGPSAGEPSAGVSPARAAQAPRAAASPSVGEPARGPLGPTREMLP